MRAALSAPQFGPFTAIKARIGGPHLGLEAIAISGGELLRAGGHKFMEEFVMAVNYLVGSRLPKMFMVRFSIHHSDFAAFPMVRIIIRLYN